MNQKGAAALVLTIIVTIASLVLGAGAARRAITSRRQASFSFQATQAQKFADAGVEYALSQDLEALAGSCPPASPCKLDVNNDGSDDDVSYLVEKVGGGNTISVEGLKKDEVRQIDLTQDGLTDLDIEWTTDAIITYSIIKKNSDGSVVLEGKGATDPVNDSCNFPDWYNDSNPKRQNPSTPGYNHKISIGGLTPLNVGSGEERYLRIRPLYCTDLTVNLLLKATGSSFPTQGHKITSTGKFGEAQWTVEVTKMNPALPSIFDYAIFSEERLVK